MADKKIPAAEKKAAKKAEKKPGLWGRIKGFFARIGKYLKDTRSELKKVVWPSPKETRSNTIVVIAVVAVSAVFMIALDMLFGGAIHLMIGA